MDIRETHIIGDSTQERIVNLRLYPSLREFGVHLLGHSLAQQGFHFVRFRPQIAQILVCLAGEGRVWVDGNWVSCGSGTAYVTPAGAFHAYRAIEGQPWEICWIILAMQQPDGRMAIPYDAPTLIDVDPLPLKTIVDGMYGEATLQAVPAVLRLWMELLLVEKQRLLSLNNINPRLRQLWNMVDNDLTFNWTVEALAAHVGVSGEHLRRLCKQHFNSSPMRQVTLLRLKHAAALLASDAYTVEAVALRVGYENAFAFSTAFKRVMGLSPTEYRRNFNLEK